MSNRWRIIMVQETGERTQYGDTFRTFDLASDYISSEELESQHPECQFFIEPDILYPWATGAA